MNTVSERLAKLILDSLIDGKQYSSEYFIIEFTGRCGISVDDLNQVLLHLEREEKIRRFTLTNPITGVLTIYYEATSTI